MNAGMMRRWSRGLWLSGLVVWSAASVAAAADGATLKIVLLDMAKTFDGYKHTQDADAQLSAKGNKKEGEHSKLVEDIKKLREGMDLLSDKAKQERQSQLEDKMRQLQEFEQAARGELQRERDQMARTILEEIDQALQEYAAGHTYDVVLTKNVVVYGKDTLDITADFLAWLNKRYKP